MKYDLRCWCLSYKKVNIGKSFMKQSWLKTCEVFFVFDSWLFFYFKWQCIICPWWRQSSRKDYSLINTFKVQTGKWTLNWTSRDVESEDKLFNNYFDVPGQRERKKRTSLSDDINLFRFSHSLDTKFEKHKNPNTKHLKCSFLCCIIPSVFLLFSGNG